MDIPSFVLDSAVFDSAVLLLSGVLTAFVWAWSWHQVREAGTKTAAAATTVARYLVFVFSTASPELRMDVCNRQSDRGGNLSGLQNRRPVAICYVRRTFRHHNCISRLKDRAHRIAQPE